MNDAGEWERCHEEEVPFGPKEDEPKPADPAKPHIVDITDQLPKGFAVTMFLDGGEWPEDEEELMAEKDKGK